MNKLSRVIAGFLMTVVVCPAFSSEDIGLQQVEQIYDFGGVGINFEIFHKYQLLNPSSEPIRLDSVHTKCDCSRVWLSDSVIAPGDTGIIGLSFSTKNYYGRTSKSIKVHTNSAATPYFECFYLSTVGQWLYGLAPDPVSLFFLPGHKPKKLIIQNPVVKKVEITAVDPYNDVVEVKTIRNEAKKGKNLELEVSPKNNLGPGTYHTNFRLTIELGEERDPLFLTIPVKIVRY